MASSIYSILPADRAPALERRRREKMACSAHAYVRGNTQQFYTWLDAHSGASIPHGPIIWIGGDCHVGNLGPVANAQGRVEMQIRDLDQTVVGNPAHDLIRLGLSLATATRGSDLPGITTTRLLEQMVEGYEQALATPRKETKTEHEDLEPIQILLKQSYKRRWRHLAEERIENVSPTIPLGKRFWPISPEEREEIEELFQDPAVADKVTALENREKGERLRVLDAAYWVKGCSSLGRLRYAVLLGIGKKSLSKHCLIDLKEATAAAAPRTERDPDQNHAERVVTGACHLSPFLGERMLAVKLRRRPVVLRELMPQDLKLELDQLTQGQAVAAGRYLATVVGKAHGRQMDPQTRKGWLKDLQKNRTKSLDAPSWLWSSVIALIADHEVAYLEHCRKCAST